MNSDDIHLNDIADMVAIQLGRLEVGLDDDLYGDLGAESMDLMHLAIAIEDRYGVFLPEEQLGTLATVRDLHTLTAETQKRTGGAGP